MVTGPEVKEYRIPYMREGKWTSGFIKRRSPSRTNSFDASAIKNSPDEMAVVVLLNRYVA